MRNGHILIRVAVVSITAVALSGCFDLAQRVAIDRDGSGQIETTVSAGGLVGEALKSKSSNLLGENRSATSVTDANGVVTQRSRADFKALSDLVFQDQVISLSSRGSSFFGLGPSEMTFRRSFHVDRARAEHAEDHKASGDLGAQVAQSILGNHTYVFSVTLPGSIERIAPITIGGQTIEPSVTGDFFQHTITWRMPLYQLVNARALNFEVDFSAYGTFTAAQTRRG